MALRDYLREEELTEEDQIAMARESISALDQPDTAYMDFGIEETEPLPQQGGDLASFIDQIAPAQQQQQRGSDIQQMAIQSLMAGAPPPQAQQMPQTTDVAPAQQYRDEVQKARATGKPLDILGGVLGAFAGGQAPRGPSFADIRGGARGMDLIRQIQEQRAQRQFQTQQGKVQREQTALDLTAQQRQQGQGAQSAALLQVFPEMSPETAEALSLDPKAFASMMRHGEQLRQEKQDAARRQDERGYQEAQWKERQAIQQADRIALKGAGRRGGGGGGVRLAASVEDDPDVRSLTAMFDGDVPEEASALFPKLAQTRKPTDRQRIISRIERVQKAGIAKQAKLEKGVSALNKDAKEAANLLDALEKIESLVPAATDASGDIEGIGTGRGVFRAMTPDFLERKTLGTPALELRQARELADELYKRIQSGAAIGISENQKFALQSGLDPNASETEFRTALKILSDSTRRKIEQSKGGKSEAVVAQWERNRARGRTTPEPGGAVSVEDAKAELARRRGQ